MNKLQKINRITISLNSVRAENEKKCPFNFKEQGDIIGFE